MLVVLVAVVLPSGVRNDVPPPELPAFPVNAIADHVYEVEHAF